MRDNESSIYCGSKLLCASRKTYIMGIINVTPDSFSDGGEYFHPTRAIEHGVRLLSQGADILDVGGVSTRPGHDAISEQEELARVLPVIRGLKGHGLDCISVDTMRAVVAEKALENGASWINDQSAGLFDEKMPVIMRRADGVVLMHNQGFDETGVIAGERVVYQDVIHELRAFFENRMAFLRGFGVSKERIVLDPGIGFSKGVKDSLTIINNMDAFSDLACMSLIGVSRKSFLGHLSGIEEPKERDYASLGAQAAAIFSGANIVRTHNVQALSQMSKILDGCIAHEYKGGDHEDIYEKRR